MPVTEGQGDKLDTKGGYALCLDMYTHHVIDRDT